MFWVGVTHDRPRVRMAWSTITFSPFFLSVTVVAFWGGTSTPEACLMRDTAFVLWALQTFGVCSRCDKEMISGVTSMLCTILPRDEPTSEPRVTRYMFNLNALYDI